VNREEIDHLELPEDWEVVPFEVFLQPVRSCAPKVLARDYRSEGRFPIVDQGQGEIAGYSDDEGAVISDSLPVIVFGDHTRLFKYVGAPFAAGADGTKLLSAGGRVYPRFAFYHCLYLKIPSKGYSRHYRALAEQLFVRPPLPEQKKIAAMMRKVQEAVEVEEALAHNARDLKKSLMRRLFTRGLRDEPVKETEIGPVPESWEVVHLHEAVKARGGSPFPHKHQGRTEGDYPFYKVSDMNLPGNEVFMSRSNHRLDSELAAELGAKPFPKDTIVFPKVGGALLTNKKRRLTCDSLIDNNMMGVVSLDHRRCSPDYLHQWFETLDLRVLANPGPLPSLNNSRLYECVMPLPKPTDQQQIARILRVVDEKIAVHEAKRDAYRDLFKTLLHKLMTAEIRVHELDIETTEEGAA